MSHASWQLSHPGLALRRLALASLVLATTAAGVLAFWRVLAADGMAPLEAVVLGLFSITFTTSCMAFWTMLTGILLRMTGHHPVTLARQPPCAAEAPPLARTALIMPAYNEDMAGVVHCLTATWRSLRQTGESGHFD